MVFRVAFVKVDMIDIVTQQTVIAQLRAAEEYATQRNYVQALALMSEAFDKLLDDYADRSVAALDPPRIHGGRQRIIIQHPR